MTIFASITQNMTAYLELIGKIFQIDVATVVVKFT